ncbi:fasciclin domain-containing protein [Pedobacter nyackensis]|uniref:fasciclin domain-containing protein n=1 Tax=Pedobacter nyackensis TaxID=475255 RepID=UPI00292F064B|nr:fasciclin domain-containing protein [Pedobacter nyackensis]
MENYKKKNMKIKYILFLAFVMAIAATSCKKDKYIIGGSLHDPHVNMTTYDYLKTNRLFDTLLVLIDKAGMKDEINGNVTFFAPTDYSIKALLERREEKLQQDMNDESLKYTLNDLPVQELRDSLRSHLFNGKITRESLSLSNKLFTSKSNEPFSIRLIEVESLDIVSTKPKLLFLVKLRNGLDPDPMPDNYPDENKDQFALAQTSNIQTTTGVLHVLHNIHRFYW